MQTPIARALKTLLYCGAMWAVLTGSSRADSEWDFNRDVRPILSEHCFACHGPDEQERQGGLDGLRFDTRDGAFASLGDDRFAIVAGDAQRSELVRRIWSTDDGEVMPPADQPQRLSSEQKQRLTEWIEQGAPWSRHWAYEPPRRWIPPTVQGSEHVRNWIDSFILARLEQAGIAPAPPADHRTLIRRLYFDLLGLPPSPDEVQAFVRDPSPNAWERLVDQLLDSPHFGERMAMYWLDLVRYADTVGYHGDQPVSVSPYRDHVIRTFNLNVPFDRFTREQLGGDLMPDATNDQLIASGYNRLGMMSAEGGVQDKEYLAKYAADRVRTASAVWLGSTLGCAECHDHKFDPFTTNDFYRFAAFFADIEERGLYSGAHVSGKWGPQIEVQDGSLPVLLRPLDRRLKKLEKLMQAESAELSTAQQSWEQEVLADVTQWEPLVATAATAAQNTQLAIQEDGSILASGPPGATNTYTVHATTKLQGITGFRLELLPHESLPKQGPGRGPNGEFVLTELRIEVAAEADDQDERAISLQNAQADFEQTTAARANPYKAWIASSVIDQDKQGRGWGWAVSPQQGRSHQLIVETAEPPATSAETATFVFHLDQNRQTQPQHKIGRFRLWATTAARPLRVDPLLKLPDEVRQALRTSPSARSNDQQQELADHFRSITPLLKSVRQEIASLQRQRSELVTEYTRTTLVTRKVEPREVRVLPRGNWMDDSGQVVQPGVPTFLGQITKQGRADRLDLANWIVSRDNPLASRVMVNRLWKLYFGTGLSKVLDDFGTRGESPAHPELLDTLAVEFVERGWDVKQMVRLIVNSATYRQSSLMRDELQEVDPYNRLLARQSRFRIDAEMVRDSALSVSGLLVRKLGGRSVKPYQPAGLYRHLNFPKREYKADPGKQQYRRGLYTHWQRQFLHPAMKSFDAPAREECTAERPRSNTPLAALVLLNDPSYVEAARSFAELALREGDPGTVQRIDWIMLHALGRPAKPSEQQVLVELLESQRQRFAASPAAAEKLVGTGSSEARRGLDTVELAAWTAVTRTVFNLHEFITRN